APVTLRRPSTRSTASRMARATHMSEGLEAMHCSLVPSTAWLRLKPSSAAQPDPGTRLLQADTPSRKYGQRVRCITLPATVAMLRSCGEAPARIACDSTG